MLPRKLSHTDHNSYSRLEEQINTMTHAIGFVLAIIGLVVLFIKSRTVAECIISVVYGLSLAFMFLSSSMYHATENIHWRAILRKVDHTAIYLLIAGTYSPFLLLAVGGQVGWYAAGAVWAIGIMGIAFKMLMGDKYPKLGVATYALMGWFALFLIYPIYQSLSASGFSLLVLGGLCYSLGIPFYMMKSRHYSHAVWHVFVVAGAACHFLAIYFYIL